MEAAKRKLKHLHIKLHQNVSNADVIIHYASVLKSQLCKTEDIALALGLDRQTFVNLLSSKKKKAKKLRGSAKDEFLEQKFLEGRPEPTPKQTECDIFSTIGTEAECEVKRKKELQLKEQVKIHKKRLTILETNRKQIKVLKKRADRLKRMLHNDKRKCSMSLSHMKKKLSQCQAQISKHCRQVSQYQRNIAELTKQCQSETEIGSKLRKQNAGFKTQIQALKVQARVAAYGRRTEKGNARTTIKYLEHLLQDEKSNIIETLDTTKHRTFSTDTTLCVMNLLNEGVGVNHVASVMENVAELCGKTFSQLPSATTVNRIADQRISLSHQQIVDTLPQSVNTTLQSDETRKYGDTFEVFAIKDDDRQWVLGLRDMASKSADNCLNTFQTILSDIEHSTTTQAGNFILGNIKNTMSDRAATEKKFHTLLEEYRSQVLPTVYDNWDQLCELERESLAKMNNFYCGLHILVNFADISSQVVTKFEELNKANVPDLKMGEDPEAASKKESGSIHLIRAACKCFARGGDEKSGCYRQFHTYLCNEHLDHFSLVPFRGNRFNIMFFNAELVFFFQDHIKAFFETMPPTNRLHKSVCEDIQNPLHLAVLKALGMCSKLVTAPFWRALEKECTLMEANIIYTKLSVFLSSAQQDCTEVLTGDLMPFPELVVKDEVYTRLMASDDFDTLTCAVLQLLFQSWHTLLLRAAGDHLPGGKFFEVTDTLAAETSSFTTHNKFPERIFSLLDFLTRQRPAASTLCNEAYIMFSLNKTAEWLRELSDEKRREYLDISKTKGLEMRAAFQQKVKDIREERQESLQKKRADKEKKEAAQAAQRQQMIDNILYFGLWQYPETVDEQLRNIKTVAEKRKALKSQLVFRKTVLCQKADKGLFFLSEKGKAIPIQKLAENVKTLINLSLEMYTPEHEQSLTRKRIIHYQMSGGVRTPYPGRVVSSVPGYPAWYNVVYDGEPDVYVYKLAEDLASGDLEIVKDVDAASEEKGREEAEDEEEDVAAIPIPVDMKRGAADAAYKGKTKARKIAEKSDTTL